VNEQLREDISALLAFARKRVSIDCPEWGALMRVSMALDAQPTTPEPAGETVRVRAGVYRDETGNIHVHKSRNREPLERLLDWPLIAIIEADIPLPRIPTVATRVVEDQS
jgi:hypothetical protein